MGKHNSLVFYKTLTLRLHRDIAQCYPKDSKESRKDAQEIMHRFNREGISFLTKTLPRFGKAIDFALQGNRLQCREFEKIPGMQVPKFLRYLTKRFIGPDGLPLNDRTIGGISALRQFRTLVYFNYKLELPYDEKTTKKVLDSFIATEQEIAELDFPPEYEPYLDAANLFIRTVFHRCPDPKDSIPRHGPGAVATGETVSEKSHFTRKYWSLEDRFPERDFFFASPQHYEAAATRYKPKELIDYGTAKVVLVPKDSRGPRLISCEPLEIQWIQQGLLHQLVPYLETHPLTRGHVNFTCQEINRQLAMLGSQPWDNDESRPAELRWNKIHLDSLGIRHTVSQSMRVKRSDWVTLDMKDASDRISLILVERLFEGTKYLEPLKASRSRFTVLPDGRQVKLAKFAPMGSAVCFPVEALCFFALAVGTIWLTRPTIRWREAIDRVFVYGDDIITTSEDYARIITVLESVGLRTNKDKCCVSGLFRESCGCDAFVGVDVTPIRLRKTWDHRGSEDATQLVSYVSMSNRLYKEGYYGAAEYIRTQVELLYGVLPNVPYEVSIELDIPNRDNRYMTSRVIGFCRDINLPIYPPSHKRWIRFNRNLCLQEVRGYIVLPIREIGKGDQWEVMLRTVTCGSLGGKRNDIYAVPHRSRLKRGWGSLH